MARLNTKIALVTMKCRRGCGRSVTTLNRSISGAHEVHAELSGICEQCITPEERRRITEVQVDAILKMCGR